MAKCPECGALIDLDEDEIEEGEVLTCPDCDIELEVVNIHPVELDVIGEEEEEKEGEEESDNGNRAFDEEREEEEEEDYP